ncbi:hypothetical protein [Apibacter sp. HY039]|uniref:hypothetical protein n=1 Tax=Apibacter sp. HY039 TaxID=2501476 RepID=UPI000FEBA0AE|nr:hypothetical protein [Apibacter sp. HY039]
MTQFKELILLIVIITSLKIFNSCAVINRKSRVILADKTTQIQINDTLVLSSKDYEIISLNNSILDIEVTNNQIISLIENVKYSVIKIEIQQDNKIAKGNNLLSSFVPKEYDYFYSLNKGYIHFVNNRINFRKIMK